MNCKHRPVDQKAVTFCLDCGRVVILEGQWRELTHSEAKVWDNALHHVGGWIRELKV